MTIKGLIWKSVIAGSCGTIVHFLFMYFRTRSGVLPSFQPYQAFQFALSQWVGTNVPEIVPWALSFVNGMTILGFLVAWFNRLLPGRNGALKGLTFGLLGWVFMNLIFFPLISLGPFAMRVELGIQASSSELCISPWIGGTLVNPFELRGSNEHFYC
jgi:hypothetical protein